mmetsp:Transcript_10527/g.20750  ORF Transcript_10527/g.20750 Transcript_10527/m.20750 type:complete len:285 (+) Transcript_10527:92-946(+)
MCPEVVLHRRHKGQILDHLAVVGGLVGPKVRVYLADFLIVELDVVDVEDFDKLREVNEPLLVLVVRVEHPRERQARLVALLHLLRDHVYHVVDRLAGGEARLAEAWGHHGLRLGQAGCAVHPLSPEDLAVSAEGTAVPSALLLPRLGALDRLWRNVVRDSDIMSQRLAKGVSVGEAARVRRLEAVAPGCLHKLRPLHRLHELLVVQAPRPWLFVVVEEGVPLAVCQVQPVALQRLLERRERKRVVVGFGRLHAEVAASLELGLHLCLHAFDFWVDVLSQTLRVV